LIELGWISVLVLLTAAFAGLATPPGLEIHISIIIIDDQLVAHDTYMFIGQDKTKKV
jgi:hypothetical protein